MADWAWAAGLFEGEGCIGMYGPRSKPRLTIYMTDRDVVERFSAVAGYGVVNGPYDRSNNGTSKKLGFQWSVAARDDVARILRGMIPYFGARRRAKAAAALHWIAQLGDVK